MASEKNHINEVFSSRLQAAMREKKFTQKSLGEAVGVVPSAVFNWLHGTMPSSGDLYRAAKALGKPIGWFFEVIPYNPPPEGLYDKTPIAQAATDSIPPEMREHVAGGFEVANNPELKKLFQESWMHFCDAVAKNKTSQLTSITQLGNTGGVKSELEKLMARVKRAAARPGAKAELARLLDVAPARITEWLSDDPAVRREPGGYYTLELLKWVEHQERQK